MYPKIRCDSYCTNFFELNAPLVDTRVQISMFVLVLASLPWPCLWFRNKARRKLSQKKKEEEGLKISNVPKEELDSCRFVQHEPVNCSDPSWAKVKLAQLENILLNPSLAKDRASNGTEVYRSRRRCNLQTISTRIISMSGASASERKAWKFANFAKKKSLEIC